MSFIAVGLIGAGVGGLAASGAQATPSGASLSSPFAVYSPIIFGNAGGSAITQPSNPSVTDPATASASASATPSGGGTVAPRNPVNPGTAAAGLSPGAIVGVAGLAAVGLIAYYYFSD